MKSFLAILLMLLAVACRSSFYVGEDGEYMVVLDKKVSDDPKQRTVYTVKNITQEHRFLRGSRVFDIHSFHVFHIGDTVQLFRLDSGKWRGKEDADNSISDD